MTITAKKRISFSWRLSSLGITGDPLNSTLLPHAISEEILGALPLFRPAPVNGHEIAVGLHDKLMPTLARSECEMVKAGAAHASRQGTGDDEPPFIEVCAGR